MKIIFIIFLFIVNSHCIASSQVDALSQQTTAPADSPQAQSPNLKNPLPSLGTCDQYADYYIYKCMPFKCIFNPVGLDGVAREMQTIGMNKNDQCVHKITIYVTHPSFRNAQFNLNCNLSPEGRAEMAKFFTDYKKGDLNAYNKGFSPLLSKECR